MTRTTAEERQTQLDLIRRVRQMPSHMVSVDSVFVANDFIERLILDLNDAECEQSRLHNMLLEALAKVDHDQT